MRYTTVLGSGGAKVGKRLGHPWVVGWRCVHDARKSYVGRAFEEDMGRYGEVIRYYYYYYYQCSWTN